MTTIEDIIRIAVNAHDEQTFPSKEKTARGNCYPGFFT